MEKRKGAIAATTEERTSSLEPLAFYRRLRDRLLGQGRLVLATVISRFGSGPREPGTSMIINTGGKALGTVGGGLLEARVVELAAEVLREGRSAVYTMTLTAKEEAESGMICGGRVEVLVECLESMDPACLAVLNRLPDLSETQEPGLLIRSIRPETDGEASRPVSPPLLSATVWVRTGWGGVLGNVFYAGSLDMTGMDLERMKRDRFPEASLLEIGLIRYFLQPLKAPITVIIVGAGHVGQALAALCPLVGFRTVVIDDRTDFANHDRFPAATDILIIRSLENCFSELVITKNDYVVIVTRGHAHDRSVLVQSLHTGAGYIGMIGSRTKRDAIYGSLISDGFTNGDLARVYSPIGLAIGAKTPAEIAVSIVAELIAVRSEKVKDLPQQA